MENHVEMSMLMGFYGTLLTEKQQDILSMYYDENLSLAEISEITNTSRQAIHDIIRRCHKQLLEYEEKLKLKENAIRNTEAKHSLLNSIRELKENISDSACREKIEAIEQEILKLL
ncbi:putative DNA-binding protein [Clostridium thermarum]|uniref:putative DNA-binding protein n=1 Tax=Clostridium thermarum TaxID=1716543 RepID=UPI00112354DD|nr:putative DNA-binding protein [Clostridium thermarum]